MMKKYLIGILVIALLSGLVIAAAETPSGSTGTFMGEAEGYNGPISVTVTLFDGRIIDVTAIGEYETEGIGGPALIEVPTRIVAASSADVDVLSGATLTSVGVINAVKAALPDVSSDTANTQDAKSGLNGQIDPLMTYPSLVLAKLPTAPEEFFLDEGYEGVLLGFMWVDLGMNNPNDYTWKSIFSLNYDKDLVVGMDDNRVVYCAFPFFDTYDVYTWSGDTIALAGRGLSDKDIEELFLSMIHMKEIPFSFFKGVTEAMAQ